MRQMVRGWAALSMGLGIVLLVLAIGTVAQVGAPRPPTVESPPISGPPQADIESTPEPPQVDVEPTSDLPQVEAGSTPSRKPLVAVDAGHGGTDAGGEHRNAQGVVDLTESQVNLQIALLLRDALQARGCDVYLTRSSDDFPDEPMQDWNGDGEITVRDDLQLRVDRANAAGADVLISLHENALDNADPTASCSNGGGGTTTYYCADRPFADRNLRLATLVHREVLTAIRSFGYEPADQGIIDDHQLQTPTGKGEHIYILGPHDNVITRPSLMPGVLSEPLFITCEPEEALLTRADFRAALAKAYANAITDFLRGEGWPLASPTTSPTLGF